MKKPRNLKDYVAYGVLGFVGALCVVTLLVLSLLFWPITLVAAGIILVVISAGWAIAQVTD